MTLRNVRSDSDPLVRSWASYALEQLGDISPAVVHQRAVDPAHSALLSKLFRTLAGEDEYEAREAAARALGRLGDKSAIPALIKSLDTHGERSSAALKALGQLSKGSPVTLLAEAFQGAPANVRHAIVDPRSS